MAKVKVLFVKLFPRPIKRAQCLYRQVAKRERKSFQNCQDWRFSVTVCAEKRTQSRRGRSPSAGSQGPALLFWLQRRGSRAAASAGSQATLAAAGDRRLRRGRRVVCSHLSDLAQSLRVEGTGHAPPEDGDHDSRGLLQHRLVCPLVHPECAYKVTETPGPGGEDVTTEPLLCR